MAQNREARSLFLFKAALDEVKLLRIQDKLLDRGVESESVTHTGTNKGGQIVSTIEELRESHLNLPYSRLLDDQEGLLEKGGVDVGNVDVEINNTVEGERDWVVDADDLEYDGTEVSDEATEFPLPEDAP